MDVIRMSLSAVREISGSPEARPTKPAGQTGASAPAKPFQDLLNKAVQRQQELQLSKHVQQRMQQRHIQLDAVEWQKVRQAVQLAEAKGIRDSLVVTGSKALIVNIPNRTVITAMDRQAAQQRIFTNIDGAIIME